MFGINGGEFIVLVVVALVLVGPERLPEYAEQLGKLVRTGRRYLAEAKKRVDEELGDEVKDVDWARLDPRQYDPRKIVRDALLDPVAATGTTTVETGPPGRDPGVAAAAGFLPHVVPVPADGAPYDDEAT